MNDNPAPRPAAALRSLGMTVYAPTFLFAVGQGAVVPILALAALDVDASIPAAAVLVAIRGIGAMAADIPGGMLIGRLGERRAMSVGTGVLILSLFGAIWSPNPIAFGASMFLMGCGWSVWLLARLAYVTDVMPIHLRGRALSTMGGMNRIGNFVGPFLGAIVIAGVGLNGAFYVHMVSAVAGWLVLLLVPDTHSTVHIREHVPVRFRAILSEHATVFATAGVAALAVGMLRSARDAVFPLWGQFIGLDAPLVAVIFGISSATDVAMFYPAGSASDRFGRKFVAIPCISIMAAGFILLPMTSSFLTMALVGLLLGFGNGLGSGIIMTLGADFSPPRGRAEFLGVWRTLGDVGTASGPTIVSAVTTLASLTAGSVVIGGVGLLSAGFVLFRMPEPLKRHLESKGDRQQPGNMPEG
jgi:MFS family permease